MDDLDPKTAEALDRAVRDVRRVKLLHVTLLAIGFGILAVAVLAKAS
jgi:hypothetical protein